MLRVYRFLNLLSLDVAFGAALTTLFFSKLLQAPVRYYGVVALGLTVWIIYTIDRLMDVRQLKQAAISERHKFHQNNYKVLSVAVGLAIVVVCILAVFIRPSVLIGGLVLAPLIAVYLLLQKKLPIKELAVAVMYTVGVLLPAWPGRWNLLLQEAAMITQLFFIALTNLLLFAWFETAVDQAMGQHSLATRLGKQVVARWIFVLVSCGLVFSLPYAVFVSPAGWIIFTMWLGLAFIYKFHNYFGRAERYRLWGDAIFYLPAIGLFMKH
ncbi:MAG: hypothetical protein KF856_02430 [Cyclobacteriaceae bacterium]|nr:hypothetical protein [Cyclobacteriaceae bacterium]